MTADETLATILAARARRAPDGTLVALALAGVVGAAAIALFASRWWRGTLPSVGVSVCVALATFGLWGIADRMRSERAAVGRVSPVPAWAMRTTAVIGFAAGIGGAVVFFLRLIGTWIS